VVFDTKRFTYDVIMIACRRSFCWLLFIGKSIISVKWGVRTHSGCCNTFYLHCLTWYGYGKYLWTGFQRWRTTTQMSEHFRFSMMVWKTNSGARMLKQGKRISVGIQKNGLTCFSLVRTPTCSVSSASIHSSALIWLEASECAMTSWLGFT